MKEKFINHHPVSDLILFFATQECRAAFVFFKTRYAAVIASEVRQSSNPTLWVTDPAPEPHDVYWSNLWIPYNQLWVRRLATLLGSIGFAFLFTLPVTFVQGLSQLDKLQQSFPFMKGLLKRPFINKVVTGYLPSVILLLFLYTVPPLMMLFSTLEGPISRSGRKRSACYKVLCFYIWNVFFVNVLSGSVINNINVLSNPKQIPQVLAKAIPTQASFFITYVLNSGWASLSSEAIQLFSLLYTFIRRYVFRMKGDFNHFLSFPYHTELPRVLLFGLLGFTCAVLAPLILPFLLVYFIIGYIVYRNQILNVYIPKYETGGQMWPLAHNVTIFSLVLSQIIALGVFGIKKSTVAAGFMVPLVILTLLYHEYCRKRFRPIFMNYSAQDLIDMDQDDERCGRMDEIHQQLQEAYCQFSPDCSETNGDDNNSIKEIHVRDGGKEEMRHPNLNCLSSEKLQKVVTSVKMINNMKCGSRHSEDVN